MENSDVAGCEFPTEYDIWHSLKRVQAATYRTGFNFWDIFRDLEPPGKRITAEHKFLSVLCGPLKNIIGLSNQEILNIAAYFKTNDGRVDFDQFCRTIHDSDPPEIQLDKKPEEDEPFESKQLHPTDERNLKLMLTKMACTIEQPYILRPYFQEYQAIKKRSGLVSISGFFRILGFMGINMCKEERNLIESKYGCGTNTLKYAAFLKDLVEIKEHLSQRGMFDTAGRLLPIYQQDYPSLNQSFLPSPDIFAQFDMKMIGLSRIKNDPRYPWKEIVLTAFAKLKHHVKFEELNLCDYFLRRDPRSTGRIPLLFFQQAIEWIKYSRKTLSDLYLSHHEKILITELYIDPEDSDRFLWHNFVKDVYEGMDMEEIANWPITSLISPPKMIIDRLPKIPYPPPDPEVLPQKEFFEQFHQKVRERNVNILALLRAMDKKKTGLISVLEFGEAMKRYFFLFTNRDLQHFLARYGIGQGMLNYEQISKDFPSHIEHKNVGYGIQENEQEIIEKGRLQEIENSRRQSNIVEVLAKIKRNLICFQVKLEDELKRLDHDRTGLLPWDVFHTTISNCGIPLSDKEKTCLREVFQMEGDPNWIEYLKFYPTVDEENNMPCLTRLPLHDAMKYEKEKIAKKPHEFVNFDDRIRISKAIKKLSNKISLGGYHLFKNLDPSNTGLVDRPTFLHILYNLGVLHLMTLDEIDSVMKGFGYEINHKLHIDYQDFLNALDIVFRTEKAALHL